MVEIIWQDPPPRKAGAQGAYAQLIEALKKNPGRWALVSKDWKTSSPPAAFRQAGCEATCRRNADKKSWSIYARYAPKGRIPADPATQAATPAAPKKDSKAAVQKAVAAGTALRPPAPAVPRRTSAATPPPNDFGLAKFRADREARGATP
ncbi:hypothetical protein PBI_RYAN_52 [Arthrobacter phage Ryan]|uniref:Uncharacterized protein n=1 Tax=Arthrobacter phage Ryan TaxID=2419968 RepID=A0A3G2KJ83_9CAUD|nr:hypothetical protein QEO75_gp57 [Arthrobacter phage Ryan]AYN59042.1 hypothetical protein PBI_RYAN_52 [Arthrobacter phage Ryan]